MQTQERRNQEAAAALLRGLRAGSSQAWARLYDQLAPGIHRFAASCLSGDTETAEEVVVETLADAARGLTRFDPQKSSLSTWIYGIAQRVVQTELRKQSRRKSTPVWAQVSFEDLCELADSRDLGARTAARLDAQRRLQELPALLTDEETELLSLSAVDELPVREIGRVVGRSEQATRMLLHRARQKARRTAIEGTLVVQANDFGWQRDHYWLEPSTLWFGGMSDWRRGHETGHYTDLSPVSEEIVYSSQGCAVSVWPPPSRHIWKAKRDGSRAVNLTEQAGLGGVNAYPRWSPDGTMVAFAHWDPGGEALGLGEAWVVKADGSEAHRAASRRSLPTDGVLWSPDGSRLFCCGAHRESLRTPPMSVDLWGRQVQVEVDTYGHPAWSPDGSKLARIRLVRGEVEGEPGWWRQLVVGRADGSRPRVVVEQFVADALVDECLPSREEREAGPGVDWRWDVLHWAGPLGPTWSPTGEKIAFLAEMPFGVGAGVAAWVYDLVTRRLTKITSGPQYPQMLSWR